MILYKIQSQQLITSIKKILIIIVNFKTLYELEKKNYLQTKNELLSSRNSIEDLNKLIINNLNRKILKFFLKIN
jgi:hypothetical protein